MRGQFWSCDTDGDHTILSTITDSHIPHAKLTAQRIIDAELRSIKVLHCRNNHFRPFCSCDLDLDPITFICEIDLYSLEITRCANMNFVRQGIQKLTSDRNKYIETDRHN